MMSIPSHIRYPAMIVGLLGMTLVVNAILIIAVNSDGGAQVVDDYYEKSIGWDDYAAKRRESATRRWTLDFDIQRDQPGRLAIKSAEQKPVDGLVAQLHLRRPHLADEVAQVALTPIEGQPGVYQFEHPARGAGVWEIIVDGEFEGRPVLLPYRYEIR